MKQILIILGLFASITTFAQSPRIKLNQITKDSVVGSVLISSPTDSGMVYSRDLFISYGVSDTVLILGGDTLAKTSGIISSVLSDGVTITGNGTTGNELTADTSVLATIRALSDSLVNYVSTTELSDSTSNIRTDIPLIISDSLLVYVSRTELSDSLALISSSVTADGVTITGDGTVGSPLKVDTATVVASVGRLLDSLINVRTDLDLKQDQLNGTGFVKATGTTITYDNSTYLTTEVDGSVTNEIQDISTSGAAGNISISSGSTLNLNVDDADASATNEGSLTVGAGTASTSVISSNTSGSTDVTLTAGTNVTLSETGNNITISATGGGGSYNNISETADTVYISDYLDVDTSTLYVDAVNNRVGIGTSSPSKTFEIKKAFGVNDGIIMDNNGNGYFQVTNSTGTGFQPIFQGQNSFNNLSALIFKALQSTDTETFSTLRFIARKSDDASAVTSANPFQFTNGSTNVFEIEADGGIIIPSLLNASTGNTMYYNTTSDEISYSSSSIRFKNDIEDFPIGLNELMMLKPTRYTYIPDGKKDYGFIAEQVYDVGLTEFVTFNQDNQIEGLKDKYFMILNTKAIQEQQAIIETQATEIEQLKTLITELSNRLQILENN